MRKFIKHTFLFLSIYLTLCIIISIVTPYHWGNPWYSAKIQHLEKSDSADYNTYFFGSSVVYRHIVPSIFDSESKKQGLDGVKSFNLGSQATFNPQTYYLYEQFLKSPLSENMRYCFIELRNVDELRPWWLHQERTTYWQNYNDLLFVFRSIHADPHLGAKQKLISYRNYAISYLEGFLHLGHFGEQLNSENYYDKRFVGDRGYFPLELDYTTTQDSTVKKGLRRRKNSITKRPWKLKKTKEEIVKSYAAIRSYYKDGYYDEVNLERINSLIKLSEERGIRLIFILSSRSADKRLIRLSRVIPKNHIIDMSHPRRYKSLYSEELSFDAAHLNSKGARWYTRLLAREFVKKIKQTNKNKKLK